MHATHRGPHDEPQMVYAETFRQQAMLCLNHVQIAITRKPGAQPITRLARLAMPNSIRENDKVAFGIEKSAGAKQLTGKFRADELRTAATRTVHDEHRVTDNTLRIALGLS